MPHCLFLLLSLVLVSTVAADSCDVVQPSQWTWYTGQNITGGDAGRPQVECMQGGGFLLPICGIGFLWPSSITCNNRAAVLPPGEAGVTNKEGWDCVAKDKSWLGYRIHLHCGELLCAPAQQCSVRFDARPVVERTLRGVIAVGVMGMLLILFVFIAQMNTSQFSS